MFSGVSGPALLVGPAAVLVEVGACAVLLVALAVALHADAVEQVQQPDRQPGGDQQRAALHAGLAEPGDRARARSRRR